MNNELDLFLSDLQDQGVVDITRSKRPIDALSMEMLEIGQKVQRVIKGISEVTAENEGIEPLKERQYDKREILSLFDDTITRKNEVVYHLRQLKFELASSQAWGEFNREDISRLGKIGFNTHFYITPIKKFDPQWENQYILQEIKRDSSKVYYVILSEKGEDYKFSQVEVKFPERPASAIKDDIDRFTSELATLYSKIVGFNEYIDQLKEIGKESEVAMELYLASNSGTKEAEDNIIVLEGFAPKSEEERLSKFLENSPVVYLRESAQEEDDPPVELKNNWYSRLFEPIGGLYLLPKYNELDMTPFFAPFYMLFFGLCLGDMGYGIVLITLGLIAQIVMPSFKAYAKLIVWLGIGTVIMPMLSGTFFGAKIYEILGFSESISSHFFTDINLFWFAIAFGVFHLIYAKLIRAFVLMKKEGFPNGLHEIGWSMLLAWAAFMYAGVESGKEFIPQLASQILLYGGLGLIFLFTKTKGNIIKRIVGGVTSLWDITGLFGDILSYIRLFGLGLSGGCLGMVINSIAFQLSGVPYVGWGLTIIMLIFGHSLVILVSCIGAFVHPIRLTFVEFYKNSGFEGGGRSYRPLRKL